MGEPISLSPCALIKVQNKNTDYKAKVKFLQDRVYEDREFGFRADKPNTSLGQTGTQYPGLSNFPGTNFIDFDFTDSTFGFLHSHYDGLINIFSPDDINTFIQLLINAYNNGIPLDTVYMTLVSADGSIYQLWGSNSIDVSNLTIFTKAQIDALTGVYEKNLNNPNITTENLQKGFFEFMEEFMNIPGSSMYSIDSDGNASQIGLSGGNLAIPKPCP